MKGLRILLFVPLALVPVAAAQTPAGEARVAAECSQVSTGLLPLTDMGKRRYRGQAGGLYPGAQNRPSRAYLARGLAASQRVKAIKGRVVVLSIGIANADQEFRALTKLTTADPEVNQGVKFVDGAMAGWDARKIAKPKAGYWRAVDRKLVAEGATARDVQVVWLKTVISGETRSFPGDAKALRNQLRTIVQIMSNRYHNLRLVYVSSRTYGGYAITPFNPEPAAYDSGFSVKWLVQERIVSKVKLPWVGWGPYLWADGLRPRNDGLIWSCEDFKEDGTQPSATGATKVARLLLRFFKSDSTAEDWFLARS
ncbi:MAG: hypothetical protein ACJ75P_02385 [Gaiellaceae bacterium]